MSYSSSATSSLAPSRSSTPVPPPPHSAQITGSSHQIHTTKLSHKLLHMFDTAHHKYAIFQATVTIHELTNIPQLEGEYAVSYKFRGKRPKAEVIVSAAKAATAGIGTAGGAGRKGHGKPSPKDRLSVPPLKGVAGGPGGISPKPSLPNLKLQQPSPSPSSVSIASSTKSTTYISPTTQSQPQSQNTRLPLPSPLPRSSSQKAYSLPVPSGFTPISSSSSVSLESGPSFPASKNTTNDSSTFPSMNGTGSTTVGDRSQKKISDPTPLRNSIGPLTDDDRSSSPHLLMEEPEEISEGLGTLDDPTPAGSSSSSRNSMESSLLSSRLTAPRSVDSPQSVSAVSSTSHLSVPLPRTKRSVPPTRSGTTPSPAVITGPVIGSSGSSFDTTLQQRHRQQQQYQNSNTPQPLSRSSTLSGDQMSLSSSPAEIVRRRSLNGTGVGGLLYGNHIPHQTPIDLLTSPRKGSTPARSLRSHTVSWEYQVQHMFKIPMGKPVPLAESLTPSSGPRPRDASLINKSGVAPILGAGPMSESGLKLTIEQLATKTVTPTTPKLGDGDSNGSKHGRSRAGHHKTAAGDKERTVFGYVNIDLAPFAGLGPTTRKFLLKDSRTNATVRITVDMKWIGGEDNWAAPPMQEGHHATGIKDLTGNEAQEQVRSDLHLRHTPSRSSSSDISSLSGQPSNRSGSSINLPRAQSTISLVTHPPQLGYKSYEHHLKDSKTTPDADVSAAAGLILTPPRANSRRRGVAVPKNDDGNGDESSTSGIASQFLTIPMEYRARARSPSPTPSISPGGRSSPFSSPSHARRPSHRHHTHHMRGSVAALSLNDPAAVTAEAAHHELPPEFVIEAIFNPRPAGEETPFTYVPMRNGSPLFGDYTTEVRGRSENDGNTGGQGEFGGEAFGLKLRGGGVGGGGGGGGKRELGSPREGYELGQIEEHPPSPKGGGDLEQVGNNKKGWGKLKRRVKSGANKENDKVQQI